MNTKHSHHSGDSRATSLGKKRSLPSSGTAVRLCSQKPGLNHPPLCCWGGQWVPEGGREVRGSSRFQPCGRVTHPRPGAPGVRGIEVQSGEKDGSPYMGWDDPPRTVSFLADNIRDLFCSSQLRSCLSCPSDITRIFFSMFPLAS